MPHNNASTSEQLGDAQGKAQVLERPAVSSGETVWQAEIIVNQGSVNHTGRARTFTIRGPPRKTREAAAEDAEQLTKAAPEGGKVLRTLANKMHRG